MAVLRSGSLAGLMFAVFFALSASAADVHGVLQVVKGDVQIKSGQTGQMAKAKVGGKVFPKDAVITGKDSRAKIVMIDKNVLNVSPESNIVIQNYEYAPEQGKKDVLINVLYGKVRSKVEQKYDGETTKFQVKTATAVAGVRGTDFLASYDKSTNSSSVVTFEGTVAVGTPMPGGGVGNIVAVTPGKSTDVPSGGAPSQPQNVPKSELASMDSDSKADSPAPGGANSDSREPAAKEGGDKKQDGGAKNEGAKNEGAKNDGPKNDDSGKDKNSNGGNSPGGRAGGAPPAGGSSSGSNGAANGPGQSPGSGGGTERMPASTASAPPPPPPPPDLPKPPPPPEIPRLPEIPGCGSTCNDVIKSGKSNVNVIISPGGANP